ncbi:MAG TPA: alpha/beta hydrolase-fold protein [Mucilaginibacter sp.]|nr:alpha/beta hydrolase-fold protein [Mucilaginibacter sp.]
MIKRLFTLVFVVVSMSAYAQKDNRIVIGTVDTVYSKILNEKRTILIHVPHGGSKDQRYPVLYILDGESHFQSAVAIDEQLSGVLPDMIIVGVTNTVRERDLTPTKVSGNQIAGGGENFISFIEKELMPYVESKYPTAPYRVFSGHSLGGLTVINAFINHTALFNAYIAIDPSLWWDGQKWVKQIEAKLPQLNFTGKSLFVGIANNIPPGMDTISVMKDTANSNTLVTRSVLPFVKALRNAGNKGLRWTSKFYTNERHGTVELNAEYDALRYLFNYYQFRTSQFEGHPELNMDVVLAAHFKVVSDHLGYKVLPSEDLVNELAYSCMGQHKMDDAYKLFKRNIDNHPESANAFDSMGDYYEAVGDKQKAIEAYSKSLNLHETADTRRKMEGLKEKK